MFTSEAGSNFIWTYGDIALVCNILPCNMEVHMLYQKLGVLEVHHFTAGLLILGFWEFVVFIGARSCFGALDKLERRCNFASHHNLSQQFCNIVFCCSILTTEFLSGDYRKRKLDMMV
jgi:hypothetical protein